MTEPVAPSGFWSYVHKDNEQAAGRILRLADRLRDEFSLLTGQDLALFVDRESLAWGDEWRARIDAALQETTFFIPIVTPRYFTSGECRKELLKFITYARSFGATELLLPILYVSVPALTESSPDEAKVLIASTQYADWRDLRLADEDSEEYARAVNRLALRLAAIADAYASRPTVVPAEVTASADGVATAQGDDEPGLNDRIADLEELLPLWTENLQALPETLTEIQGITQRATARLQGEGQDSFARRVLVAREMANELAAPSLELSQKGEQYASLLLSIDTGVRAIISLASEQEDEEDVKSACEMFAALRELIGASQGNEEALRQFIEALKGPARLFRDLRPALRDMEAGMRSILDAHTVMDEWLRLMNDSELDCSSYAPAHVT